MKFSYRGLGPQVIPLAVMPGALRSCDCMACRRQLLLGHVSATCTLNLIQPILDPAESQ
jgi:hypothetical protein